MFQGHPKRLARTLHPFVRAKGLHYRLEGSKDKYGNVQKLKKRLDVLGADVGVEALLAWQCAALCADIGYPAETVVNVAPVSRSSDQLLMSLT